MDKDNSIEVTEEMVRAGLHTLFYEYEGKFDPIENDAHHFVTRIFEVMQKAQPQSPNQVSEVRESRT